METASIRVPKELYDALRVRAAAERRSAANMAAILLEDALGAPVELTPVFEPIVSEPWPEPEPELPAPTAAEKEYATGDPIPDTPESVAVKARQARAVMDSAAEHFHPDFGSKLGKKK